MKNVWDDPHIPVIEQVDVHAGVREDDAMYCRITLRDVENGTRMMDMSPDTALDLIAQLALYARQIGIK